jgi:hypothetical protein
MIISLLIIVTTCRRIRYFFYTFHHFHNENAFIPSLKNILGVSRFAEQLNGAMSTHVRKL